MRINRIGVGVVALAAASALVLTGCSSGGSSTPTASANSAAIITANGSEPQNPLIPTNTQETGGGRIVDSIFAGLVYYDATGKPVNDMADSITPDATSQTFTIKLKPNETFSDGEPVDAASFVNAWQYGALLSNAQLNQSFFSNIEGYSADADSPLTGLTIVDPTTFTVKLSAPQADFPLELGYAAFYPLPANGLKDMTAFGTDPIGNGPYKLASPTAWQHNVQIDLVKNDTYTGGRQVQNGGLTIKFYADLSAAYADLQGGNLDVLDEVPDSAFATFESDLGSRAVNEPSAVFQSFTIPGKDAHFSGQEGQLRRQALSEAIDRDTITKVIFNGTRTPASDFTSPVINGWTDSLTNAGVLKYNPDDAKKLWAEADAISPWSGTFQIAYNADGGHQGWVDAVSNSIKNTLGIDASGAPVPTFAAFRTSVTDRTINTAFRTGWQADYPGLSDFLAPLYATGASSNDGDYSNPAVDALFTKASAESTTDAANKDYQDAQNILLTDLPAIPLWYSNITGGYGTSVSNVSFGWNSEPLYYAITKS